MRNAIFVFAILAVFALPARANWQYTRWGMTRDEVIAASQGAAKLAQPEKGGGKSQEKGGGVHSCSLGDRDLGQLGAEALYKAGRLKFRSCFFFGQDMKLTAIELVSTTDSDDWRLAAPHPVYEALFEKYGVPEREVAKSLIREADYHDADWRSEGNRIRYLCGPNGLTAVFYKPLSNSEANGL